MDTMEKLKILWWFLYGAFDSWKQEIWKRNLDGHYCCPGQFHDECGCGGVTVREMYSNMRAK